MRQCCAETEVEADLGTELGPAAGEAALKARINSELRAGERRRRLRQCCVGRWNLVSTRKKDGSKKDPSIVLLK